MKINQDLTEGLSEIPEKRYFTIGEVSEFFGIKTHILRYWEQEFYQLKPIRRGKRRYYRYADMLLIRKIWLLLYKKGFTIGGARQQLKMQRKKTSPQVLREVIREVQSLVMLFQESVEDVTEG